MSEAARIEYVLADDGCPLWTASSGVGPPMVLCHGGPGLWDYLGPVASMLDGAFTVHRWDQRGGGRSASVPAYTRQQFVDDLEAIRTHYGYEQWVVGGHSWGASLALEYALQHPERTRALLYISGTGIGGDWRPLYYAERRRRLEAAGVLGRWEELGARPRSLDEERELCLLTWMTDYVDVLVGRAHAGEMLSGGFVPNYDVNALINAEQRERDEQFMRERCGRLDVATLVVHGVLDPRPVSAVRTMVDAIAGARLEVIDDAGHLPWVECGDEFARIVRGFLASVSG